MQVPLSGIKLMEIIPTVLESTAEKDKFVEIFLFKDITCYIIFQIHYALCKVIVISPHIPVPRKPECYILVLSFQHKEM